MRDFKDELKKKDVPPNKASDPVKIKVKKGGKGRPLNPDAGPVLRSAFGKRIDEIRIHTDAHAANAAGEIGAQAFTEGKDIYFAEGEYSPSTGQGRRLLAHEITHVIQQKEGQGKEDSSREALEREAEKAAGQFSSGEKIRLREKAPAGTLLMEEEEKKKAPTIAKHKKEIMPVPPGGKISGPGYAIEYLYNVVKGADFTTLNLNIPKGVAINVTSLSKLGPDDYRVQGSEGIDARTVTISVSAHLKGTPSIQVSFTRDASSYIVVFQFTAAKA